MTIPQHILLKKLQMEEKRVFINIYKDENGKYISDEEWGSYESAFEKRDVIYNYVETVEIIRFEKPPKENQ